MELEYSALAVASSKACILRFKQLIGLWSMWRNPASSSLRAECCTQDTTIAWFTMKKEGESTALVGLMTYHLLNSQDWKRLKTMMTKRMKGSWEVLNTMTSGMMPGLKWQECQNIVNRHVPLCIRLKQSTFLEGVIEISLMYPYSYMSTNILSLKMNGKF